MRYSYEFKLMCIDMYRSGRYPATPEGINQEYFHGTIRKWVRLEEAHGPEVLKHSEYNKVWTPEEKLELVSQVIAGKPNKAVALEAGISDGLLYQWVRRYRLEGYQGLAKMKKGRPPKEPDMKHQQTPAELNESEREELIRLRAENEHIKAEIEVIKKEIALREEKEAARLKAKKQRSSKSSAKKDTH